MDYQSKNHAKFLILYHLIFVCKYRKKLLVFSGNEVKQVFEKIATRSDFAFEELEGDQDHIHCLVKSEPRISPLAIIRRLRTRIDDATLAEARRRVEKRFLARSERFGVMTTSAVPLEMPVKQLSEGTLRVRDDAWRFIHEAAEDFAVFSPSIYKRNVRNLLEF